MEKSVKSIGITRCLIISMEEISELIDVLCDDMTNYNYLHTVEELTDAYITTRYLELAIGAQPCEVDVTSPMKYEGISKIISWVKILAVSQQNISKWLRKKTNGRDAVLVAIKSIYQIISEMMDYFYIPQADIDRMLDIKIKRLEDRIAQSNVF